MKNLLSVFRFVSSAMHTDNTVQTSRIATAILIILELKDLLYALMNATLSTQTSTPRNMTHTKFNLRKYSTTENAKNTILTTGNIKHKKSSSQNHNFK